MTGITAMNRIDHSDAEALHRAVAERLASVAALAIRDHGRARLALAGGSTPMPIYRLLSTMPLDWPQVSLLPGDERWVADSDPASNLGAMREAFGDRPVDFRPLTPAETGPQPSLDTALASYRALGGLDACLLGMGTDGHFASLFPRAAELRQGLDPDHPQPLIVVHPRPLPPDAPYPRISLTLGAILASDVLLLAIRGAAKRDVLEKAAGAGSDAALPISELLKRAGDRLEIHWSP